MDRGSANRPSARRAPPDLLLNPHDFDGLVGQDRQRMVQTRRIDPNLVVADRFEDEGDFLARPEA
jgi:hypothetical protein